MLSELKDYRSRWFSNFSSLSGTLVKFSIKVDVSYGAPYLPPNAYNFFTPSITNAR